MNPPYHIWQQLSLLDKKINEQNDIIFVLRERIEELSYLLQQSSNRPQAEKIEYNFEQLKIETLEGTLNIGLTPNQPLPFEHVDLPSEQHPLDGLNPIEQSIYNQLLPFIKNEIPNYINRFCEENDITVTNQWKNIMTYDIEKQIPARIKEHSSQFKDDKRTIVNQDQVPMLVDHIKKEIYEGINSYLNRIKETYNDDERKHS